jgi:hypothetical protein
MCRGRPFCRILRLLPEALVKRLSIAVCLAAAWLPAAAKTQDECRADGSKFEQAIGFIRQTQGNQAAAELKEKLLPAKLENEILMKDGYCGLAKYIKDRKLDR